MCSQVAFVNFVNTEFEMCRRKIFSRVSSIWLDRIIFLLHLLSDENPGWFNSGATTAYYSYKIMSSRLLQNSCRRRRRLELKSSHVIMQEVPTYGRVPWAAIHCFDMTATRCSFSLFLMEKNHKICGSITNEAELMVPV